MEGSAAASASDKAVFYRNFYDGNAESIVFCNRCDKIAGHPNMIQDLTSDLFNKCHQTCLCKLVSERVICCMEGYKNLLRDMPYIALHTPVPLMNFDNWLFGERNGVIVLEHEPFNLFYNECLTHKITAMNADSLYLNNCLPILFVNNF